MQSHRKPKACYLWNAVAPAETVTKGVSKRPRRMAVNLTLSAWKRQEGFAKEVSFELGFEE